MEPDDLSITELRAELRRARGLESVCRDFGEVAGATPHRATARAIEAKLRDLGEQP